MQKMSKPTNKLIDETSPYLLQHAHNPVEWYPWGDEAFEKARAEDKPLLVSIGYSACHWCHVMERESFEDDRVAAIQNEHFVNIKVDMEERPDVDQIYMNFVQLTTGRGGWPMNVFITADKKPFFGGTYFPPNPRYGMPSWEQILTGIADAWAGRRDELLASAGEIVAELRKLSDAGLSAGVIDSDLSEHAYQSLVRSFDAHNGGFGGAPKFPPTMSLEFLLRYWKRTGDDGALEIVIKTAVKMANGGIYDQLGGGFHRYAVDAIWLVPHFEKMLYDNAQLIRLYLHLYQIVRSRPLENLDGVAADADLFRRVAVETLEYVRREMLDPSGGFYSSQDADSEGEEGRFFVWTPEQVESVLGKEMAKEFNEFFDVTPSGNFEGSNILNVSSQGISRRSERFDRQRSALFTEREKRVKPFRDEKVLTAWNGLMLSAFAEAAAILDSDEYLEIAERNADFLIGELVEKSGETVRVLRTWKNGKPKLNGYIEDYANLADGLIDLYQVSGKAAYIHQARALADAMITEFWDEENGGFFFTSNDHEQLIIRNKDFYDNATPSGNSVAADVLQRIAKFFGDERYDRFASTVLRLAAPQIKRFPNGFGRALGAVEFRVADGNEVAIVGGKGSEIERSYWEDYRPFSIVAVGNADDAIPLLDGRSPVDSKPTAYVCRNFVCSRPVTEREDLEKLLDPDEIASSAKRAEN